MCAHFVGFSYTLSVYVFEERVMFEVAKIITYSNCVGYIELLFDSFVTRADGILFSALIIYHTQHTNIISGGKLSTMRHIVNISYSTYIQNGK